jgi:outer membrane biosynthesis protein TonB
MRCPAGAVDLNTNAVSMPAPSYPAKAKARHIQGIVSVPVLIDELGRIETVLPGVKGPRLLRAAAIEAARQATFSRTKLSGIPVKVCGVLTFDFSLDQ